MSIGAARTARQIPDIRRALVGLELAPLAVGALTLAVFFARLSQMHQSLFGDELWTYQQVAHHSLGGMLHAIRPPGENAPPLYFLLAWISAKLGDPTVWIRLPSLILGTATIPLIYALGRETVGRAAGLIGATVAAASPFAMYYGIEARPYATAAFFVVLSSWALVIAVRTHALRWWAIYVVAAAGAAYSHYTTAFILIVQVAWALWACRGRLREPLIASACIAALYAPWLPHVGSKDLGIIGALVPFTVHTVIFDPTRVLVGYTTGSLRAIPTLTGMIALTICALLGATTVVLAFLRGGRTLSVDRWSHLALIPALVLATPAGVLLYSLLRTDIWDPRDLYVGAPITALAFGALLSAVREPLRTAAVAVVLGVLVVGTIRAVSPSYARPMYRVAAQYLDRVAGPRDPIIMYPSFLSLDDVLPPELRRPHVVVKGIPARWPATPPGGSVYVVFEDGFERALAVPVPHPAGFELTVRRHYSGLVSFSVLGYRRVRDR